MLAWILLIVGGLNWLLVGLLGEGVGDWLGMTIGKIIYILVGLAALFELFTHKGRCKDCSAGGSSMGMGSTMPK